jgi:uncharacterized membrane protein (UPF0127 family)
MPLMRAPRYVFIYNQTKETFLSFRVKVADSIFSRLAGLLGKRSLHPDSGVWIVPANAVHTIGMLFTFDLVLIDKDFKVVGLRELVRPFKITRPNFRAESVIELPAHTIFRSRTEIGDKLVIDRYEAKLQHSGPEDAKVKFGLQDSNVPSIAEVTSRQPDQGDRQSAFELEPEMRIAGGCHAGSHSVAARSIN